MKSIKREYYVQHLFYFMHPHYSQCIIIIICLYNNPPYNKKQQHQNTIAKWLGILSFVTGSCSVIYWQDQKHYSWKYYLDLSMAKFFGIVYFVTGWKYVVTAYKRNICYGLLSTLLFSYHMSNSWYLQGFRQWYLWHGLMHLSTNIGCIHILQSLYDNSETISIPNDKDDDNN